MAPDPEWCLEGVTLAAGDREFLRWSGLDGLFGEGSADFQDTVGVGGLNVLFLYPVRKGNAAAEGAVPEFGPVTVLVLVLFLFLALGVDAQVSSVDGDLNVLIRINAGKFGEL